MMTKGPVGRESLLWFYHDDGNPIVEKEPNWAVNSYRFQQLARSVSFRIGLAHVRRATAGVVTPLHTSTGPAR